MSAPSGSPAVGDRSTLREMADQAAGLREAVEGLCTALVVHVVVPVAIMALVLSALFFLLELRGAVIAGGTFVIKWIGCCFVAATVLIVRYARTGSRMGQALYLGLLGLATTVTILQVTPSTGSFAGNAAALRVAEIANLLVTFVAWWLATVLTRQMSLDEPEPVGGRLVMDGDGYRAWKQQREHEESGAWAQEDAARAPRERPAPEKKENPWLGLLLTPVRAAFGDVTRDAHGSPARGVVRVVLAGLVVFAVAEPTFLQALPHVGPRALDCLIVFLFSAGVLLAAGSVVGTMHHVTRRGGEVRGSLVAWRTAAGAGFVMLVLAVSLLVPGLNHVGSGEVAPRRVAEVQEGDGLTDEVPEELQGREPELPPVPTPGPTFLAPVVALLGKLLLVPVVLAVVFGAAWILLRLKLDWSSLLRGAWKRGFAFLARLFGSLGASLRWRRAGQQERVRRGDPLEGLEALEIMEPEEAVRAAYGRVLDLSEWLGRPRPEEQTALEFLRNLPSELRGGAASISRLTLIYARVAYGPREARPGDRDDAIAALRSLRELGRSGSSSPP